MFIRVFLLLLLQTAINRLKPIYDRFIIRDIVSKGKELPMQKWFDINFWKSLSVTQILGVGSLALWKLITFPLGVWIGSFSLALTYPMSCIVSNLASFIVHPVMLFIIHKGLNEFSINTKTMIGLALVMIALVIGTIGWYLIYVGNKI